MGEDIFSSANLPERRIVKSHFMVKSGFRFEAILIREGMRDGRLFFIGSGFFAADRNALVSE